MKDRVPRWPGVSARDQGAPWPDHKPRDRGLRHGAREGLCADPGGGGARQARESAEQLRRTERAESNMSTL